jgi:hypothetical protein
MSYSSLTHHIDELLLRHQAIWRSHAYQLFVPTWLQDQPELCHFLLELNDDQVRNLQGDDLALLTAITPFFDDAKAIHQLIQPYQDQSRQQVKEPPAGIPGRKWQQILAFCHAQSPPKGKVLEWCSGKSYLGRAIHQQSGQNILALEINSDLVNSGHHRAAPQHQLQQCDVLSDKVWSYFSNDIQRAVALHACGGLHQRLLQCASHQQCPEIALSPCCYHRFIDHYRPLSPQLQSAKLQLDKTDLRTAVRQSSTAHQGEIASRRTLQSAQLAFRVLLQDNSLDSNMPLPSLSLRWAKSSTTELLQHYRQQKSLTLNYKKPIAEYHNLGAALLARAERLELARMAFRRLLELRCVLDGILFLEEQGYRCTLKAFCHHALTPRNLLLFATKQGH